MCIVNSTNTWSFIMITKRKDVKKNDCWNVEFLYPTHEDWKKDYNVLIKTEQSPFWPELSQYKGKLGSGINTFKTVLGQVFSLDRNLSKLYTYAHLRHDEDITNDTFKVAYNKISAVLHGFSQEFSWLEPEILSLPEKTLESYLNAPELTEYKFHLEKLLRKKKHTLSAENEELLALSGLALQASHKAFSAINDADFKFGKVLDQSGNERDLTHAQYGLLMRDQDRVLRENAFKKYHGKYGEFENTLAELLNGQTQAHIFNARARKYPTALDAALYPKNIDVDVYHSLIQAVNENMSAHHKYVALRKKVLGFKTLHLYDMNVPLTNAVDINMTYEEAEQVVIDSVAPLGADYQNLLRKGLKEDRWVDRYENENKRSGAYSSGCYDSVPYILMNYKGIIRDVFTLAHEAGHSMHSLLTHKHQPYIYGDYSIFLAEVASTFNEDLLTRYLLDRTTNPQERIFLINQKVEDIRATLFRQTMFAEFELFIHTMGEQNVPLTPKLLKDEYLKLCKKYFGPDVVIDEEIASEWSRIPHFYYNYYVFQYATGISAALALSEKVVSGGSKEREDYLSFLKGGCSKYPIDLLQIAGVDMRKPDPVKNAIKKFSNWVGELDLALS